MKWKRQKKWERGPEQTELWQKARSYNHGSKHAYYGWNNFYKRG